LIDIDTELLSKLVGVLLILSLGSLFINPKKGLTESKPSKIATYMAYLGYFLVMIYDGFFGAAGGIFAMLVLVYALKTTFLKAHGTDVIPWIVGIIISIIILSFNNLIKWDIAIFLTAGMLIGGYVGSHVAIKKGNKLVKYAFATVVIVSALKLLFF